MFRTLSIVWKHLPLIVKRMNYIENTPSSAVKHTDSSATSFCRKYANKSNSVSLHSMKLENVLCYDQGKFDYVINCKLSIPFVKFLHKTSKM